MGKEAPATQETGKEFGPDDQFVHLLSVLLKRQFAPHERLLIRTCWRHYGPFSEELVRTTAGRLLGEGGISTLPFPKLVRPEEAFLARRLETALSLLQQLLATREIGVVVGEAGTGKTTLLDLFLS